MLICIKIWNF